MTKSLPPVCQSCAMPMEVPRDSGTEINGAPSKDYCRRCYQDGRFTNPALTMYDVMSRVSAGMTDLGPSEARDIAARMVAKLKRWRHYYLTDSFFWLPIGLMLAGPGLFLVALLLLAFHVSVFISGACVLGGLLSLVALRIVKARERKQLQELLGLTAEQLDAKLQDHKGASR